MDILDRNEETKAVLESNYQHMPEATIMIVDDEPITMEVVRAFLEEVGYHKFILVENPSEAMKILEETEPDLILLDLVMPGISGFDILLSVRVHPIFKHLPVIIMTSSSDTESKLKSLELGATDFLPKPLNKSELCLRVRNTLTVKACHDQLAYYDPVTNLPNKRLFMERLDWSLKKSKRYSEHLALLIVTLDNFTRLNATVGQSAGDEILRQVASRIEGVVRNVDVLGKALAGDDSRMSLFRADGVAFSLLLDRINGEETAALVAKRVIAFIREPMRVEGTDVFITASIGIATAPTDGHDPVALLQLAASANSYAKNRGGNAFEFSSKAINTKYNRRLSLETRLRKAINKQEFVLYYQPKVDVRTGVILGVESLVRWESSDGGLIPPNEFIPLAEETGLIVPIGEWVLHEACSQLKKWHETDRDPISMSVNLSVKQFNDPEFFRTVKHIVVGSGIEPDYLMLEITESLLLDDVEAKISIMNRLREIGLNLSIDDFGTGYSSLRYLSKLPVDELKIDRSFIMDVVENSDNRAIVLSVLFLAHCLGLKTVAEGVETKEHLAILQRERCDQYQGFLFSRPIPHEDLFRLLPPGDSSTQSR